MRVRNNSPFELREVRVSGRGFAKEVGALRPGETREFDVAPAGESGVAVSFRANGRSISASQTGYFEDDPSYVVNVTIKRDLTVDVTSTIGISEVARPLWLPLRFASLCRGSSVG